MKIFDLHQIKMLIHDKISKKINIDQYFQVYFYWPRSLMTFFVDVNDLSLGRIEKTPSTFKRKAFF